MDLLNISMKMENTDKLESLALDLDLDARLDCMQHLQGKRMKTNFLKL